MLKVQFDGDMLVVRPEAAITRDDVTALTRTVDEYLADHPKIAGVIVETRTFPGFSSVGAFADYALASLPITTPACGGSHWVRIQPSRLSRSSGPITLLV